MLILVISALCIACFALYAETVALKKRVKAIEDLEPYQLSNKVAELEKRVEKSSQRNE